MNLMCHSFCVYLAGNSSVNLFILSIAKIPRLNSSAIALAGFVSIALISWSDTALSLEPPQYLAEFARGSQTPTGKMLFVNPNVTRQGDGSDRAPFKTITQALQVAAPDSAIMLTSGTYSSETGESFPLKLKPGVSIQGDPRTRGSNIIIKGGGTFLSPTFAGQNITILGASQATLTGVTITNPNPRGYGLWIESSSPTIVDNTFTANKHDGVSITGNSTPLIRSNYFYQNGANGITIYGVSRPEVRENVFEKTGFGINVSQKAAPLLIGNRITQNRAGVVVQASAQPILRNNAIEANEEDGVVAIASSQPDLGTQAQPGGNVFRQNKRYDINSKAATQTIPAFGNTLAADARTVGKIDLSGKVELAALPQAEPLIGRSTPSLTPKPVPPVTTAAPTTIPTSRVTSTISIPVPPPVAIAPTSTQSISIPVPPPVATAPTTSLPRATGSDNAIQIPVTPATTSGAILPPPPSTSGSLQSLPVLQSAQISETDLLPVPSGNIPVGNTRNLPRISVPQNTTPTLGSPPLPPTRESAMGLRYRVIVEAANKSQQDRVRSVIPGAFRTFSNGKVFMQVGAFGDRVNAEEVVQILNSRGLKGTVEQIR